MIGPLTEQQDAKRTECIALAGQAFADVRAEMQSEIASSQAEAS